MTKTNNKRNKMISMSLSAILAVSMVTINPTTSFAVSKTTVVNSSIIGTSTNANQGVSYVSPDSAIKFELKMSSTLLDALHLDYKYGILQSKGNGKASSFGILVTGGDKSYLATVENGLLTLLTDGINIKLVATHPTLDRYTTYKSYLLASSALNKYEAGINSNGNSKSFEKYLEKATNDELLNESTFETGSTIGEATKIEISNNTINTSVLDIGKLEITATDDYGNPANSGKVEVANVKTTDGSVLSDTFTVSKNLNIINGQAEIQMTNHKAQTVEVTVNVLSPEGSTSQFVIDAEFTPGLAHQITTELNSHEVTVGDEIIVTGQAKDIYDNIVLPTSVDVIINGQITTVVTDVDGRYEAKLTAPTKIDQSNGLSQIFIVESKSETGEAIQSTNVIVNPDVVSEVIIDQIVSVNVGSTKIITGHVKDKYGNIAQISKLKLTSTVGTVTSDVVSDTTGTFDAVITTDEFGYFDGLYNAPTIATKVVNISVVSEGNLPMTTIQSSFEVVALSASVVTITASSNLKQGIPATISGLVKDIYGNIVADGTIATIKNGSTIIGTITTINGAYSLTWTPSTSGVMALSTVGGTTAVSPILNVNVASVGPIATTMTFNVNATSIEKGRSITISGNVKDEKGVNMINGTPVIVNVNGSLINTTITSSGNYAIAYVLTNTGTSLLTVTVGSLVSTQKTVNVVEAGSITISSSVSTIMAGNPFTISGVVKDTSGVNMPSGSLVAIKNGTSVLANVTVGTNGAYSYTYTHSGAGTLSLTATANVGSVVSNINTVTVTAVVLPTLTANLSSTSISVNGGSILSGYAKDGNGIGMANKTVLLKVGPSLYDTVRTNASGFYTYTLYGQALSMGYNSLSVYVDNGKSSGLYKVEKQQYTGQYYYSDVQVNTAGVFVHR